MMAGYLLARAGVDVVVLEKHGDFFRDFRGDTIHPSTLEVFHELGLLDEFLAIPHQKFSEGAASIGGIKTIVADLTHLPTRCKYIAIMPQWDFLNFLAAKAKLLPNFRLLLSTEATDLLWEGDRVAGVVARTASGELRIQSDLVIGSDGRHSIVRSKAGFVARDFGAPIDVLWMRVPKKPEHFGHTLGYVDRGRMLILIDRGDYFQTGYVVRKGAFDGIKARGLPALREDLAALAPPIRDTVQELKEWDQIKLLTVKIDRLPKWHRAGLLCIGDSAHAMSPAGGVGVNFAVQDAVACANLIGEDLLKGPVSEVRLAQVQKRREWPVSVIQRLQLAAHRRINLSPEGGPPINGKALPLRIIRSVPIFRRIMGRLIGLGPRPEHVRPVGGVHGPHAL